MYNNSTQTSNPYIITYNIHPYIAFQFTIEILRIIILRIPVIFKIIPPALYNHKAFTTLITRFCLSNLPFSRSVLHHNIQFCYTE